MLLSMLVAGARVRGQVGGVRSHLALVSSCCASADSTGAFAAGSSGWGHVAVCDNGGEWNREDADPLAVLERLFDPLDRQPGAVVYRREPPEHRSVLAGNACAESDPIQNCTGSRKSNVRKKRIKKETGLWARRQSTAKSGPHRSFKVALMQIRSDTRRKKIIPVTR